MRNHILQHIRVSAIAIAVVLFGVVYPAFGASAPEKLVSRAEATFSDFQGDPQMHWIRDHIHDAKAVIIAPDIRRAGFVVGGSGGRAVMLARDPDTGNFSGPAFYTLASASFGFQAGIDKSEVVMLVMTDKGLNSLLSSRFKLGGDASIAAGPVGEGSASSVTTDVVAFSRSKGIYGGINLDGTAVTVNHDWNRHYYHKDVTPTDILVRQSVSNPNAGKLMDEIQQARAD